MNRFMIVVNPDKDTDSTVTNRIQSYLEAHGAVCMVRDVFRLEPSDWETLKKEQFDCVLVLGGDGTLLCMAGETEDIDIPLFGINLGTVGFLTEGEVANIEEILDRLLTDDFSIEERMMVTGTVTKADGTTYRKSALNDIVISRAGFSRLIGLNVSVDGQVLDTYEADGVVISTPTGSTGYNLSAGGPVLVPGLHATVITPICAHSLNKRSLLLDAKERIVLEIGQTKEAGEDTAVLQADGRTVGMLKTGDRLVLEVPHATTDFIKLSGLNFYEKMRQKLNGN